MNMKHHHRFLAEAGIVSLVGTVMALFGAFGTSDMPLHIRFAYWIGGFLLAGLALQGLLVATRQMTRLLQLPAYMAFAFAVPLLAVLIFLALQILTEVPASLSPWLYFQILGVSVGFFVLFGLIYARTERSSVPGGEASGFPDDTFGNLSNADVRRPAEHNAGLAETVLHARLPRGFPPIIALSAEDHYVKVHAAERSEMLLMKFAEAIGEVGADGGMQVHRSWWVASSSILGTSRAGRNLHLKLVGGLSVPVSRANMAMIRAAGWMS